MVSKIVLQGNQIQSGVEETSLNSTSLETHLEEKGRKEGRIKTDSPNVETSPTQDNLLRHNETISGWHKQETVCQL